MTDALSSSEHILSLAGELLEDIELGKLATEQLLLKVSRLARLTGASEISQWLSFELSGYHTSNKLCMKYMRITGRLVDEEKGLGHWDNFAGIDSALHTSRMELQMLRIPDVHYGGTPDGTFAAGVLIPKSIINGIMERAATIKQTIRKMAQIRGKIIALIHVFVSTTYYERLFSNVSESVFDQYKKAVDHRLAGRCGDVLRKFPAVYNRLSEDDPEAVSQALATCRRIIDAFADSVFPATGQTAELDGNIVTLDQPKVLNRLNAYINARTTSDSRRKKLRDSLKNLYGRTSAGVHSDVSQEEARALLLNVYLVLGEVIMLPESATSPVTSESE
jgi:hypothetical protein